ncbi:MAG: choline-sulfatase [Streptosporangiales bacterium]|nr:choline-sulfatase [Streptosporangiales bacterium]
MTDAAHRPNVLLLMADQLSASWLPSYGHTVVSSPAVDRLAADAVVFENAYCPSPLCAPSRASMLTGRLPSRTGVYDNAADMRPSLPTLAHHLRAAGYRTCLSGKMHFVGPDQLHGFEERLTTDIYPGDLDWTPDWRLPMKDRYSWYHTMDSVQYPARCRASMPMDYDDEVAFQAVRKIYDFARDPDNTPFFLTASFTHPHDPWELRSEYWDRYDLADIPDPTVPRIPLDDADAHSRRLREMFGADEVQLGDEQVRKARHGYYAAVSYVDARIGELLDALDDSGLADDTIVVLTSDHGEMLGERGLWYKMSFYEHSARVPLMIRVPGRTPRRVEAPVSLLDLAPTVVDLSGVTPDRLDVDGMTLAPLVDGRRADRGAPVVAEYLAEGVTAPAVMVRNERFKLIRCPGDPDLLYDLATDPDELDNLAGSCAYAGTLDTLGAEVESRWDLGELDNRVRGSQLDRLVVAPALTRGIRTDWDFCPYLDGSSVYVRSHTNMYELQRRSRMEV